MKKAMANGIIFQLFQFQYGAIKRGEMGAGALEYDRFQFQYGAIKSG